MIVNRELPIADHDIAGVAHQWDGIGQSLAARRFDKLGNIELALAVGSGHDPNPIDWSAPVDLGHEVETVGVFVDVRCIPVRIAILMPRDRGTSARVLDEEDVGEGSKVVAVDFRRDLEELGMAV